MWVEWRGKKKVVNIGRDPSLIYSCGYGFSLTVIIIRNGIGDPSSNTGQGYLCFTLC